MEFVWFKDYGKELRTRVVVGWGGTKGDSFNTMRYFQGDEERMARRKNTTFIALSNSRN
jgi:hypothetical protein